MMILELLIIDIIIVTIYGIALIVMLITNIERMNTEITSKENSIKELQYEIKEIENIKAQADNFVTNLKNILD